MKPQDDTYDVVIETGNRHYRVYFRFLQIPGGWHHTTLCGQDLTTDQELTDDQLEQQIPRYRRRLEDAIRHMKWAILNDPAEIRPDLIEFIKQI